MTRNRDETRDALLAAADRLIASEGMSALTVRRIADEADVSTMNLYSRFGGKDGLIDELDIEAHEHLLSALDATPVTDDTLHDLFEMAVRYRHFALEHPAYYRLMFRRTERRPFDMDDVGGLSRFTSLVRRGQSAGQIVSRRPNDAQDLAAGLWAACHGLVSLELEGLTHTLVEWPTAFQVGIDAAISGLRTPRASAA